MLNKKAISLLLPLLMLLAGLYFFPVKIFETNFSKIPGDLGDARFNNYILEHGYQYVTGKTQNYWDASFMYPYKNVIALSDNLIGTLPVYAFFRALNIDRETSFQFWLLALFALNFICCFWALKKWMGSVILPSVGAYVFAFSIFNLGQLNHVQVLPRFIIPFVVYWCWKYLSEKQLKYFLFTCLGIAYQFYCGVYLGFLLIYILLFLLISFFVFYRDLSFFKQFKKRKAIIGHLAVIALTAIVLSPIIMPYIHVAKAVGMRSFEAAAESIPRFRSYFFATPAPLIWHILYGHSAYAFPSWWNHFLFIGGLPWLGVLAVPFVLFSKKIQPQIKKFTAFLFFALFLSFIFCLNINGFTLYKIIFEFPGFSSMRSLDRIINVEVMLFILVFVFVFKELCAAYPKLKWFVLTFPVLIIVENLINPLEVKRIDKQDAEKRVEEVKQKINAGYDHHSAAIAFMPVSNGTDPALKNINSVEAQLNTMLACQELHIPCVNGYTGFNPGPFEDFLDNPDDQTLQRWADFNKIDFSKIQRINDIGKTELSRTIVHLKAFNHKYLSASEGENTMVTADKENVNTWETFVLFRFKNNQCVIRGNANLFFSAELNSDGSVTASRQKIAEWETFEIVDLGQNIIALKAYNGKFLSVDPKKLQLFASSDHVGDQEKFELAK